jgi:hypothetical protein
MRGNYTFGDSYVNTQQVHNAALAAYFHTRYMRKEREFALEALAPALDYEVRMTWSRRMCYHASRIFGFVAHWLREIQQRDQPRVDPNLQEQYGTLPRAAEHMYYIGASDQALIANGPDEVDAILPRSRLKAPEPEEHDDGDVDNEDDYLHPVQVRFPRPRIVRPAPLPPPFLLC